MMLGAGRSSCSSRIRSRWLKEVSQDLCTINSMKPRKQNLQTSSPNLSSHWLQPINSMKRKKQGLEWLKKVTSTDFGSVMPVERMVEDILNVNRNATSIPVRDGHHQVPDDVLLAAAPRCSCDIVHDFGMIMTFFDMTTDIDMTWHVQWFKMLAIVKHWQVWSSTDICCNVMIVYCRSWCSWDASGVPDACCFWGIWRTPSYVSLLCCWWLCDCEKLRRRKGGPSICFGGSSWHWWWRVPGAVVLSRKIPWGQHESWSEKTTTTPGFRHLFFLVPSRHHPSWGVGAATTINCQSRQNFAVGIWSGKWFTNPVQGLRPNSDWTSHRHHRSPDVKHEPRELVQGPPFNAMIGKKQVSCDGSSIVGFVAWCENLSCDGVASI